mmetsp:Transcript_37688/g.48021  ORF Transcript_37688/g.48021 Transcript_37688/m.48021 type:complete len:227 (-) Transcript_37688:149-829(-)
MFVWVQFGEETAQKPVIFNTNVACNILLDAIRRAAVTQSKALHERLNTECQVELDKVMADEASAAAVLKEAQSLSDGEEEGEENQEMINEAENVLLQITAKKNYIEGKLKDLEEGMELMSVVSDEEAIIDLADSSGKCVSLHTNPTIRAQEFLEAKSIYVLSKIDPPPENSGGKGVPEPTVTKLLFKLPEPEERVNTARPTSSKGGRSDQRKASVPPSAKSTKKKK